MQVLITVPPYLLPYLEWTGNVLRHLVEGWTVLSHTLAMTREWIVGNITLNTVLPLLAIVFFFWSIILSLITAMAGASTFFFWLLTSVIFGIIQLGYVTYQFVMIACDVFGLSVMKMYSMIRNQVLFYLDRSGSYSPGKSRRRMWQQRLDQCHSYEDFLKLRIQNKDAKEVFTRLKRQHTDPALPPALKRSTSFSSGNEASPNDEKNDSPKRAGLLFSRNKSVNQLSQVTISHDIDPVVVEELGEKTADLLATTTNRLQEARRLALQEKNGEAANSLKYLLSGVIKRNHLHLDDLAVENGRSVAATGVYGLTHHSRQLIRAYYDQVQRGLDWLADSAIHESDGESKVMHELTDRLNLARKTKQNLGRTALMLSGGGAIAMNHLGVIRALIESKLYGDIKVISGTSGGSISAAMCAIKTSEELLNEVCVSTVSTDFGFNGEMKKQNIRWFPPVMDMASYWVKNKLLVDGAEFRRTCEFYFSDITFEEAFERTGKHVCITVSASRPSGDTAQRLLLNHISTPHVTIASAVAASCALPGVMAPAKLLAKNSNGIIERFEVDGVEWIDGSVQADLPFERISTLFAVSSYIVSQVNFHIVPFLNKEYHPSQKSLYWRLFQTMEWDIRNRALKLSRLGLFPKIFGQDISKVFKQRYHGNLTIVPRFTAMQTLGLKALSNPTVDDMIGYLKHGQLATWPYLNAIRDMIRLEKALDDCIAHLESRLRELNPDIDWLSHDDIESIASAPMSSSNASRVRIIGRPPLDGRERELERLREEVNRLQRENEYLKEKVRHSEEFPPINVLSPNVVINEDNRLVHSASLSSTSEGEIWNLVMQKAPR